MPRDGHSSTIRSRCARLPRRYEGRLYASIHRPYVREYDSTPIKDGDRIVGIQVSDIYGKNVRFIRAKKAVILTAGGFNNNRAMAKKYIPDMFMRRFHL